MRRHRQSRRAAQEVRAAEADEARRLFASAPVARLATVSASGSPHVVPCTFAVDGDLIYTAVDHKAKTTTNLRRLRNIRANPRVSLLVDHYDADWSALWWVRADGDASITADTAAMAGPIDLLVARYPQYAARRPAGPFITVRVDRWTGWSPEALRDHRDPGPGRDPLNPRGPASVIMVQAVITDDCTCPDLGKRP